MKLLVLPATSIFDAVAQTAVRLKAREIVVGESENMTAGDQAHQMGYAWDRTPHDRGLVTTFVIHHADDNVERFSLGAHAPNFSPEDIERIHTVWVKGVKTVGPAIHHRDIVMAALDSLDEEFTTSKPKAVDRLRRYLN